MPKIFSDAKKQFLYKSIKQNCIDLMCKKGYKQLNIRELAKITGISTGTFYNFYDSKDTVEVRDTFYTRYGKLGESFLETFRMQQENNKG